MYSPATKNCQIQGQNQVFGFNGTGSKVNLDKPSTLTSALVNSGMPIGSADHEQLIIVSKLSCTIYQLYLKRYSTDLAFNTSNIAGQFSISKKI